MAKRTSTTSQRAFYSVRFFEEQFLLFYFKEQDFCQPINEIVHGFIRVFVHFFFGARNHPCSMELRQGKLAQPGLLRITSDYVPLSTPKGAGQYLCLLFQVAPSKQSS